jgi:hypothetical protein
MVPSARRPVIDYHICPVIPEEIVAIIRTTWYDGNGKPETVDEMVIMEDNEEADTVLQHVLTTNINQGASISIRSAYDPQMLGICE